MVGGWYPSGTRGCFIWLVGGIPAARGAVRPYGRKMGPRDVCPSDGGAVQTGAPASRRLTLLACVFGLKAVWPDLWGCVFEVCPAPGARETLQKCGGRRPPHFRGLSQVPEAGQTSKMQPRNSARRPSGTQFGLGIWGRHHLRHKPTFWGGNLYLYVNFGLKYSWAKFSHL